jgi:hypothetical protein
MPEQPKPNRFNGYESEHARRKRELAEQNQRPINLLARFAIEDSDRPVQNSHADGEVDRGSYQYRLDNLLQRMHGSRKHAGNYYDDGWY